MSRNKLKTKCENFPSTFVKKGIEIIVFVVFIATPFFMAALLICCAIGKVMLAFQ